MGILDIYTAPRDPRWRGGQRFSLKVLVLITFLWLLVWILIIAAMAHAYNLWKEYKRISDASSRQKDPITGYYQESLNLDWYPPLDFGGPTDGYISSARATFLFMAIFAPIPEIIHIPLQHILIWKNHLHPVAALVLSIFALACWAMSGMWNLFIWFGNDSWLNWDRTTHFYNLAAAICITSFLVSFLYFLYMIAAAVAVHRWRMAKKENKKVLIELERREREEGGGDGLSGKTVIAS